MAELSHSEALARLDQVRQDYMKLDAKHQRLRNALAEVAEWDSLNAAEHGNIGVREFARAALHIDGEVRP